MIYTKTPKPRKNQKFECLYCKEKLPTSHYYVSRDPYSWHWYCGKCGICKTCLNEIFEDLKRDYSEEEALLAICSIIGVPFYEEALTHFRVNNESIVLSKYLKMIGMRGFKKKPFWDSMLAEKGKSEEIQDVAVTKTEWNSNDKRNKKFVLETVGYNPFAEQTMTEADLKYSFNVLADFCEIEGISNDAHKMQSVIEITNLHRQLLQIDRWISKETTKIQPDSKMISEYISMKEKISSTITKISRDNNIGSQYNTDASKGKGTLSGKMKEMDEEKLLESKVNLFDIQTSEAMQQIANINIKSILEQLNLDDSDYAKMVTQLRENRDILETENAKLKEEIRNLKNRLGGLGYEA